MACDCLTEVNKQLEVHGMRLDVALSLGETVTVRPYMTASRIPGTTPKKKGPKTQTVQGAFCPFCGLAYKPIGPSPSPEAGQG